jgi:ABC-type sugar transport system permease subunit
MYLLKLRRDEAVVPSTLLWTRLVSDVEANAPWQKLRRVTIPLLTPSLFFVAVISLINGFQVFDQVWVMTGGGPAGAMTYWGVG